MNTSIPIIKRRLVYLNYFFDTRFQQLITLVNKGTIVVTSVSLNCLKPLIE